MNLKDITNSKKILYDINIIDFISSNISNDLSIIYFSNNIDSNISKLQIYKNNIIFISQNPIPFQCFSLQHINKNIIKYLSHKVIISIDIDNNVSFSYMKYLINNLIHLFKILHSHNIQLGYTYNNCTIFSTLSCSIDNIYFNDICTTFKALFSNSKKQQYEIIYDFVCTYLDNQFICKNLCGFCDDICNAYRAGLSSHKLNGCCYTIDYSLGGIIHSHTPCEYLINKHCIANCISCKLHTCHYLKTKNIEFKIKNILLLNCFFSYKQWFVLKYNFFKTKEEIIKKLLQVNYIPSIFYYPFLLYKIN